MTEPETHADETLADAAEASTGIGGSVAGASGAPPLGNRPAEPRPGKASLADPQGRIAAAVGPTATAAAATPAKDGEGRDRGDGGKNGDGKGGFCPDCGLPFGEHPDFAGRHDPARGHGHGAHGGHGHGGDSSRPLEPHGSDARDHPLPGQELDPRSLGGDPAEA
jgi:hypothetical protein